MINQELHTLSRNFWATARRLRQNKAIIPSRGLVKRYNLRLTLTPIRKQSFPTEENQYFPMLSIEGLLHRVLRFAGIHCAPG